MKKITAFLLAAVTALSLTACASSTPREFTTAELETILSTAITENSDAPADITTVDTLNEAKNWLEENKGMTGDEAEKFLVKYGALPYDEVEPTLTESGFTAEEAEAFQLADNNARLAQMIFDTLGLSAEDIQAGALSVSLINIRAYGMAVIKPAEGSEEKVQTALENFVAQQQKSFETYLQDQYAIAKNAKCEMVNGYVVMTMGENSDAIFQSISDGLNAK
ncbi:MAG: DUF4358 domain-containing protein [Clostridiales bacterium]|nr:DUF4358 domain-containing protein [Clostridiales bacterium]